MKKVVAVVIATLMMAVVMTGCTESEQVSYNIGKEADNFNVTRKLTVINARTDTILLEMEGTFSLSNNSDNELEVIRNLLNRLRSSYRSMQHNTGSKYIARSLHRQFLNLVGAIPNLLPDIITTSDSNVVRSGQGRAST